MCLYNAHTQTKSHPSITTVIRTEKKLEKLTFFYIEFILHFTHVNTAGSTSL